MREFCEISELFAQLKYGRLNKSIYVRVYVDFSNESHGERSFVMDSEEYGSNNYRRHKSERLRNKKKQFSNIDYHLQEEVL